MSDTQAPAAPRWLKLLTSRAVVAPIAAVIVFLVLWEALVWINGWPNYVMASPSDLPAAYARYWNLFLIMGWQTLWRTVLGLAIAVLFGVAVGMIMGFSRTMRDALYPLLVGFNAIPKATVVPIVALDKANAPDVDSHLRRAAEPSAQTRRMQGQARCLEKH